MTDIQLACRSSRRLRAAADYLDKIPTKIIQATYAMGNRELQRVIRRMSLPSRRVSRRNELSRLIAKAYGDGVAVEAIAKTLRVSARTVRRFVTALDLPKRRPDAFGRRG